MIHVTLRLYLFHTLSHWVFPLNFPFFSPFPCYFHLLTLSVPYFPVLSYYLCLIYDLLLYNYHTLSHFQFGAWPRVVSVCSSAVPPPAQLSRPLPPMPPVLHRNSWTSAEAADPAKSASPFGKFRKSQKLRILKF